MSYLLAYIFWEEFGANLSLFTHCFTNIPAKVCYAGPVTVVTDKIHFII
jgi:hypothetical protein